MQNEQRMTAAGLLARLTATPDVYPQKLEVVRDALLAIEFTQAAYRDASFLDDRILGPATRGGWLPIDRVLEAARQVENPRPLHFIFHTGHVGSTLISRLLDEADDVLPLREPLPLRTLAEALDVLHRPESLLSPERFNALLAGMTRLWSRGYTASKCVILKATSSTGRLAPALLAQPGVRAIYVNQCAESAIATLLAGANSPLDLRGHGPGRIQRLCARLGPLTPLYELTPGEMAAMSWLAESLCQHEVVTQFPAQVLQVDFDEFLGNIADGMRRVLGQFGLAAAEETVSRLAGSPVLMRYSKAPEHPYGPALRQQVLEQTRREHRVEIGRGRDWLDRLAQTHEAVAAVLS